MRSLLLLLAACTTTAPAVPHKTGDIHDFDFLVGGWTTKQRRLTDGRWDEFPGALCMRPYLDRKTNVAEVVFPTKGWAGLTVRTFDVARARWSMYWINSKTGVMGTPVVGGFADGVLGESRVGDFFAIEDGKLLRSRWTTSSANAARWEQASSKDGETWVTDWTADFARDDRVCVDGRPAAYW